MYSYQCYNYRSIRRSLRRGFREYIRKETKYCYFCHLTSTLSQIFHLQKLERQNTLARRQRFLRQRRRSLPSALRLPDFQVTIKSVLLHEHRVSHCTTILRARGSKLKIFSTNTIFYYLYEFLLRRVSIRFKFYFSRSYFAVLFLYLFLLDIKIKFQLGKITSEISHNNLNEIFMYKNPHLNYFKLKEFNFV